MLSLVNYCVFSQEKFSDFSPHSAYPIVDADIQYKSTIWRKMDLREKINQPFFSKNNQLSKFLLEGVNSKLLVAFSDDSLKTILTSTEFSERMKDKRIKIKSQYSDKELKAGLGGGNSSSSNDDSDNGWGNSVDKDSSSAENDDWSDSGVDATKIVTDYLINDLFIIEIKENVIIDRKRSRLYYDIQALTLKAPADNSGQEAIIASFSYKQLHEYLKKRNDCIWFNPNNEMQHRNMADAFDLRFFNAPIIKKGNGADQFISEESGMDAKKILKKSQKLEQQLQDKEAEMWEN